MSYGKEKKKVIFTDTDKRHADLRIRLKHDGLSQNIFFRSLLTGYLDSDERVISFIRDVKEKYSKQGKERRTASDQLRAAGSRNKKLFAMSTADRERIYDILEEEVPEV